MALSLLKHEVKMKTIIVKCGKCKTNYSVYGFHTNNFQRDVLKYKPIDDCNVIKDVKCPSDKRSN